MRKTAGCLTVSLALVALVARVTMHGQDAPGRHSGAPSFSKDVAPILYKHCVGCHRPGEIAPMPLLTYEQARPYARAIQNAVAKGTMPPWHADAPVGTFQNERVLTDVERRTIISWAAAGAPRGEPGDMPPTPTFADGWALGTPDLVFEMPEDYPIAASGALEYAYFYVPTNLTEPKWVQSVEIRPGNREAVHHVLLYQHAPAKAERTAFARGNAEHQDRVRRSHLGDRPMRTDLADLPARLMATYAPGTNPQVAPGGTAFVLEPGSILRFEMHYTTNGKPTSDRSRVGFRLSKESAPRELSPQAFLNATLRLPPGASNVEVSTDLEFLQDAVLWAVFPHTHLRGKKWKYVLQLPNGESRSVLEVPNYDFNWQTYYMFKNPLNIPKGAKLISTAWYDNSAANRANPDPNQEVLWGRQTWEEMQYSSVLLSIP